MNRCCRSFAGLLIFAGLGTFSFAQTPTPVRGNSESSTLTELSRKIDQQNVKIDLLSQQILRLQQEIEHPKATSAGETTRHGSDVLAPLSAAVANGNTHVVAKGETLTSIARQHKVSISELQKLNHIEDDRKLQIGQTLALPAAPGTTAPASASPSPSP